MANPMLGLLNALGHEEMDSFGNSTGRFSLSSDFSRGTVMQGG